MKLRLLILCTICLAKAYLQDNYEIQVYGSETIERHKTMFELHSNYTFNGTIQKMYGIEPTNHIFHETIEITHGFTDWFEVGFYLFNAIGNEKRTAFVGSHIRPRVSVPNHWRMASFFKMVK